jgi:hypothetical protein
MRKVLAGAALMLPAVFLNQVAAVLGLEWGIGLASVAAVIGYGLLATSLPVRRIWSWAAAGHWRRKMGVVLLAGLVTGAAGAALAGIFIWTANKDAAGALRAHKAQAPPIAHRSDRPPGPPKPAVAAVEPAPAGKPPTLGEVLRGEEPKDPETPAQVPKQDPEPVTDRGEPGEQHIVISHGQVGGQTAHTITNLGPPKRVISAAIRAEMLAVLKEAPGSACFASTQGDTEAHEFKLQLMDVFTEAGWTALDRQTFMFFGERKGFMVSVPRDTSRLEDRPAALVVANALSKTGNPVQWNHLDIAEDCGAAYVQVWHAP